jgi:hypothetical protein
MDTPPGPQEEPPIPSIEGIEVIEAIEAKREGEAFLWQDSGKLTRKHLLELAGAAADTDVEEESLDDFLHAVPPEDKPGFDKLAETIHQHLSEVKVYKVGPPAAGSPLPRFPTGNTGNNGNGEENHWVIRRSRLFPFIGSTGNNRERAGAWEKPACSRHSRCSRRGISRASALLG